MPHTRSQLAAVQRLLEECNPARADTELLNDGSFLVTLYAEDPRRPTLVRLLGRRGETLCDAERTATGWTHFTTHRSDDRSIPARDSDIGAVRSFVVGGRRA